MSQYIGFPNAVLAYRDLGVGRKLTKAQLNQIQKSVSESDAGLIQPLGNLPTAI
jgi:hypothetical protein